MKKENWPIVPDVMPVAVSALLITVLLYAAFGISAALLPALFLLFTLYFFRNPERTHTADPDCVIAPADGIILCIEDVDEPRYIEGPALKISIFLNVFNVHVNRSPVEGIVEYVLYKPGKFLPAYKGHASHLNERNYVGLKSAILPDVKVLVVQITGFVARRVVCWVKTGERLERGQRFGLIKFGSCTEVYLPQGSVALVKKGDKVRGGETIIGRLNNE